ncbi:MAG: hypothetical protein GH143_03190 [Calditrichaeota bacterium]|nr:hypothetical protein [Calditrichota bacterium]
MDYLNSTRQTPFGPGLGLEVGNSFWFFNATRSSQLTYFSDYGGTQTAFAPLCREFWQSGHVDTLHTYGNFDEGGFQRRYAETAVGELYKRDAQVPVWVNHGTPLNHQNLGPGNTCCGAIPDHPAYHIDLTRSAGCRYFWLGRMTHILGQDAKKTLSVRTKNILQRILKKTKYRSVTKDVLFDPGNRLLLPAALQDDSQVYEFQRWVNAWGEVKILNSREFGIQLRPSCLRTLIRNEGFLIVYTHFCENLEIETGPTIMLRSNLSHLQHLYTEGQLLVTTVSRLLRFREVCAHLEYTIIPEGERTLIEIQDRLTTPVGMSDLNLNDLQGLTFYIEDTGGVQILFKGQSILNITNARDHTGRRSVSIPWVPLEYPRS